MNSSSASKKQITLVGAGLTGSLLSIFLAKRGFSVEIYERRPDMRKVEMSAGRSINLALSTRGTYALEQVGLLDRIMIQAIPMKGRMIHALDGGISFQPYGKNEAEVIYSVSRGGLNQSLMDLAEQHDVKINFNQKCTGINFNSSRLNFYDELSGQETTVPAQVVIGTDGSASAIRTEMAKKRRFNFSQEYLEHGYKELMIPPGPDGSFLLEKNALHIWPRGTYMLIALPNPDGSFTCTLFFPFEGPYSFESLQTEEKVQSFFQQQFPDATALMPTLVNDFFTNPTGALMTIKSFPWSVEDSVLLLGDAAHAIVPFFGQGMNCSFEDCTYLDAALQKYGDDWKGAFREFESARKINTDAIADLAVDNFIEMRDRVADPHFLLKKRVGLALEEKYPMQFVPKYSMVTFHRIPYSIALKFGKIQEEILDTLCASIQEVSQVDWELAQQLIQKKLSDAPKLTF